MLGRMHHPSEGGSRVSHHHERLAAVHRRRRLRRERDPPLDPGERLPRSPDRPAAAALLQHRHQHLRLGARPTTSRPTARARCSSSTPPRRGCRDAEEPRATSGATSPTASSGPRTTSRTSSSCSRTSPTARSRSRRRAEGARAKVFPTTAFGYRKVTIERPLRLNFQASPERIARLEEPRRSRTWPSARRRTRRSGPTTRPPGGSAAGDPRRSLKTLPGKLFKDRAEFLRVLDDAAAKAAGCSSPAPGHARPSSTPCSERDETAAICLDEDGNPEPDPDLRDTENVPLGEDVQAFFEREVKPHVPDAWVNETHPRREGRRGRHRRLRDQLQPLLLPLPAAAAAGRDRGRHPEAGEGDRRGCCGRWRRDRRAERRLEATPLGRPRALAGA